jgi:hypothetical protein
MAARRRSSFPRPVSTIIFKILGTPCIRHSWECEALAAADEAIKAMLSQQLYILRAVEYAEIAERAEDLETRAHYRHLAACWLRLADYAQHQQQTRSQRMAA